MYKLYIEKNISSKDLLKKVLDEKQIKDEIVYNSYGKPYLKNNELYFNISHSDCYTVLAISNQEIGVDIEKVTMRKKVIDKICNAKEKKLIKSEEDFTIMWVKKESYVKYLGIGLAYGLENVNTLELNNYVIKKYNDYYIAVYGDDLI